MVILYIKLHVGDRGGVVTEHQTPNREVLGSIPTGSFRFLWISEDFSCSSFFVKCDLLGTWNLGLSCSQRLQKLLLSTTDRVIKSPEMNTTIASVS